MKAFCFNAISVTSIYGFAYFYLELCEYIVISFYISDIKMLRYFGVVTLD